ncbi:MAG: hypothetical protein FWC32_13695 [Firmicutes bacterium]|nr:hypothetical protein [Bacillota bacterium]
MIKSKKMLIFTASNFLFIIVAVTFIILPKMRDINQLSNHISWQESQYSARARHYAAYENNLRELETLSASRRLLNNNEIILALSDIQQIMEQNSLRSINFAASEHGRFYVQAFGNITEYRIRAEYEVSDAYIFLYALENTHASVLATNIVWDRNLRVRIIVDMTLYSVRN